MVCWKKKYSTVHCRKQSYSSNESDSSPSWRDILRVHFVGIQILVEIFWIQILFRDVSRRWIKITLWNHLAGRPDSDSYKPNHISVANHRLKVLFGADSCYLQEKHKRWGLRACLVGIQIIIETFQIWIWIHSRSVSGDELESLRKTVRLLDWILILK
jgi:hypothetical protein